jgi:hypothetical protein
MALVEGVPGLEHNSLIVLCSTHLHLEKVLV